MAMGTASWSAPEIWPTEVRSSAPETTRTSEKRTRPAATISRIQGQVSLRRPAFLGAALGLATVPVLMPRPPCRS
ncbi:hypothetical protein STANM309S_05007 [Streptomyces tanashiensis]